LEGDRSNDDIIRTTVVLVHGAFADASGFGGVIRELQAAHVGAIEGPVVLVGHSYGRPDEEAS
jgi:hypothetical protein